MHKRILTKLDRAIKHYKSCRLKAKHFPRRGMYYCRGAFCHVLFFFACMPFFLKKREEGYKAYIHSSSIGKISFDEFMRRRWIATLTTLAFVGITGFTILRPIFEGNALPRKFIGVYESLTPNGWEVFFETDIYTTSTYNFLEDRNPYASGHLAVWQQKTDNGWQVRAYDNEERKVYDITDESGDHTEIRTDGRFVTWQAKERGKWRIFYWDANNPDTPYKNLSDTNNAMQPRISKGIVVWQEWLDGNWEIIKRIIGQPDKERLTYNTTPDISPDILGRLIVWQAKGVDGNSQISVWHQDVKEETGVLYAAINQVRPKFDSKGYLHWFSYEDDGYVASAYNYLSDDFIRRIIDPSRAKKKPGANEEHVVDENASSTEDGLDESATSTEIGATSTEPGIEDQDAENTNASTATEEVIVPEPSNGASSSTTSGAETTPTPLDIPAEAPTATIIIGPLPTTTSTENPPSATSSTGAVNSGVTSALAEQPSGITTSTETSSTESGL